MEDLAARVARARTALRESVDEVGRVAQDHVEGRLDFDGSDDAISPLLAPFVLDVTSGR